MLGQIGLRVTLRMALLLGVALSVAGCQMAATQGTSASVSAPKAPKAGSDIEAPEVFSKEDKGLWDGRPSLGGVWVAHPDVSDPERVIIRNTANGQSVIGALFKRDRSLPGPAFQVSSDAAEALGMLAGGPAALNVTALRRAEKGEKAKAAPAAAAEEITQTPIAAEKPAAVTPAQTPAKAAAKKPEAKKPAPAKAAPAALTASLGAAIDKAESGKAPLKTTATKPAAETPKAQTPKAAVATAAEDDAPAKGAQGSFTYIQLGIFSVEANATRAQSTLTKAGIPARTVKEDWKGKTFWRVVATPQGSAEDRAATLAKIKSLGFPDAYAVAK